MLPKDTPWEGMSKLHLGYWPTIAVLYHGQEAPYLNIISDEARQTLKELGAGYHHWALANIEARTNTNEMQVMTDRMISPQMMKHFLDWPMAEN